MNYAANTLYERSNHRTVLLQDLRRAQLEKAELQGAVFVRTNLEASLSYALHALQYCRTTSSIVTVSHPTPYPDPPTQEGPLTWPHGRAP